MSYSTVALVREILSHTALRPDKVSDGRVQDAIDTADSQIDGYMRTSYVVPLTLDDVPVATDPTLTGWSAALAAYEVVLTYQGSTALEDGDPVVRRRNAAIQMLQSVSTGKVAFPYDTAASEDNGQSTMSVVDLYEGRLFAPDDFGTDGPYLPQRGGRFHGSGPYSSGTW